MQRSSSEDRRFTGPVLRGKIFLTLDFNSGNWQVEVAQERAMPFGLCNAPATFECLMELVLRDLQWLICLVHLDDIIVVWKTLNDLIANLTHVLDQLLTAGLKLKARK